MEKCWRSWRATPRRAATATCSTMGRSAGWASTVASTSRDPSGGGGGVLPDSSGWGSRIALRRRRTPMAPFPTWPKLETPNGANSQPAAEQRDSWVRSFASSAACRHEVHDSDIDRETPRGAHPQHDVSWTWRPRGASSCVGMCRGHVWLDQGGDRHFTGHGDLGRVCEMCQCISN